MQPQTFTIGLISDTHGLLRDEALRLLVGVDRIIHAGDVGSADVLERLGEIAPVSAVRGNVDTEDWADVLPETVTLSIGGVSIHVLHRLADLTLDPVGLGIRVVVSGHSHQPAMASRDGVLYINPGSAGPRRFKLPLSVGRLRVVGERVEGFLLPFDVPPAAPARKRTRARPLAKRAVPERKRAAPERGDT